MKISVGSRNPVKIAAVREAALKYWPEAQVTSIDVPSGVSEMPMSDQECIQGAKRRARQALDFGNAHFGVGLEAGVHSVEGLLYLCGWVTVVRNNGRESIAPTAKLLLPAHIAARVQGGEELGPIMDEIMARENTKQKGGAIGILTRGAVLRQDSFAMAAAFAFAPFVSPLY